MKLFRNYGIAVVAILTIVMTSCGGGPIEHGTEYVLTAPAGSSTTDMNSAKEVLSTRMNNFGIEDDYEITVADNKITIRVQEGVIQNPQGMRKLLQSSANLMFRTTYGFGEFAPTFTQANETYIRIMRRDSLNLDTVGLSQWLVGYNENPDGAFITYFMTKDTAKINAFFKIDSIAMLLPVDAVLRWGAGQNRDDGKPTCGLYACKKGSNYELSGTSVESAEAKESEWGGMQISLKFNATGTTEWSRMTKENLNRCIAIELDDFVYSCPTVAGEITGGEAQITGAFTKEEAEQLASILKAGSLPVPLQITAESSF